MAMKRRHGCAITLGQASKSRRSIGEHKKSCCRCRPRAGRTKTRYNKARSTSACAVMTPMDGRTSPAGGTGRSTLSRSTDLVQHGGQLVEEIARQESPPAVPTEDAFRGEAVHADGQARGIPHCNTLSQEAGRDAGQDIASATGRQRGVRARPDADPAVRCRYTRKRSLGNQHAVPLLRLAPGVNPQWLVTAKLVPEQALELARVRG